MEVLVAEATKSIASPQKSTTKSSPSKPCRRTWSAQAVPFVPKLRDQILPPVETDLKSAPYLQQTWQLPSPDSTNHDDFAELNYDAITPEAFTNTQPYGYAQDFEQEREEDLYENNHDDRSLVLKGISPLTTIADVLSVVRGGAVLNVYLRPQQHTAHVAFIEPTAAEKFLVHSKRTDLYVRSKRVRRSYVQTRLLLTISQIEVFWDDRQHFLQGHLARRIYNNGATRNLVIRFAKADITEESIREDLDHIHQLVIVSIHFQFGHAWVSLNSVQQAVTARSCMSSRFKYKGTRIQFYPDECAEQLPPYVKRQPQPQPELSSKKSGFNFANRFATLTVDDESRSSVDVGSPVRLQV